MACGPIRARPVVLPDAIYGIDGYYEEFPVTRANDSIFFRSEPE
jgi:hypothetical protein